MSSKQPDVDKLTKGDRRRGTSVSEGASLIPVLKSSPSGRHTPITTPRSDFIDKSQGTQYMYWIPVTSEISLTLKSTGITGSYVHEVASCTCVLKKSPYMYSVQMYSVDFCNNLLLSNVLSVMRPSPYGPLLM